MSIDVDVKVSVYRYFAEHGTRPTPQDVADLVGADSDSVVDAFARLRAERVLVTGDDGESIIMAPPFSGVPTQHVAEVDGTRYFGNCAWDVVGIPLALRIPGVVHSRCEQSGESLELEVSIDRPLDSDWLFHCSVPANQWWDDIVFT